MKIVGLLTTEERLIFLLQSLKKIDFTRYKHFRELKKLEIKIDLLIRNQKQFKWITRCNCAIYPLKTVKIKSDLDGIFLKRIFMALNGPDSTGLTALLLIIC